MKRMSQVNWPIAIVIFLETFKESSWSSILESKEIINVNFGENAIWGYFFHSFDISSSSKIIEDDSQVNIITFQRR